MTVSRVQEPEKQNAPGSELHCSPTIIQNWLRKYFGLQNSLPHVWRRCNQSLTVPRMALAGNGGGVNERAVDVQVNRLRRKIERDPANPLFVQTVRGIGYRLVVAP